MVLGIRGKRESHELMQTWENENNLLKQLRQFSGVCSHELSLTCKMRLY